MLSFSSLAWATPRVVDLAQGTETEQGEGAQEGQDRGGQGQDDPETETDPGSGEDATAEGEEGPPWTYQMARILVVLVILLGLSLGALYYRMITTRQRGTT